MSDIQATRKRLAGHLSQLAADYPGVWGNMEALYLDRTDAPIWPRWVFLPQAATAAFVMQHPRNAQPEYGYGVEGTVSNDMARIHNLAPWRLSQGVYTFDDDLWNALSQTPITDQNLPTELFLRLPEWCVYIDFGGSVTVLSEDSTKKKWYGVFVALDWDVKDRTNHLMFLFDGDRGLIALPLKLTQGGTIRDAFSPLTSASLKYTGRAENEVIRELMDAFPVAVTLNLTLYLCSEEPDIKERDGSPRPPRPKPEKVKGGLKFFPPSAPRLVRVGEGIGQEIREVAKRAQAVARQQSQGERAPITPHIRRAHWHSFWIGARESDQRALTVKWVPPVPVMPRTAAGKE